jgi:hypothetical protein
MAHQNPQTMGRCVAVEKLCQNFVPWRDYPAQLMTDQRITISISIVVTLGRHILRQQALRLGLGDFKAWAVILNVRPNSHQVVTRFAYEEHLFQSVGTHWQWLYQPITEDSACRCHLNVEVGLVDLPPIENLHCLAIQPHMSYSWETAAKKLPPVYGMRKIR